MIDAQSIQHSGSRLLVSPSQASVLDTFDVRTGYRARNPISAATGSCSPVVLSIESIGSAVDSDTEHAVVFPGYLLPDDHLEEPVHEGR
jgi:hypothetical protein